MHRRHQQGETYVPEEPPPLLRGIGSFEVDKKKPDELSKAMQKRVVLPAEQMSLELTEHSEEPTRDLLPPDSYAETLGGGIPERKK